MTSSEPRAATHNAEEMSAVSLTPQPVTNEAVAAPVSCDPHHRSLLELFWLFLGFGFLAWGGPVAQIALIKEKLVVSEKWVTMKQFNRVLAVYQALPGPEATELCCYFGLLAHGRIGSFLAGFGFILPGFCLMLLLSWIYKDYGVENEYFRASLRAVHPVVLAMIWRAVPRIAEGAMSDEAKELDFVLVFVAVFSTVQQLAYVPFYLTLAYAVIVLPLARLGNNHCCASGDDEERQPAVAAVAEQQPPTDDVCPRWNARVLHKRYTFLGLGLAGCFTACVIVGYVVYAVFAGLPGSPAIGFGKTSASNLLGSIFLVGLMGGLLTFGGAYTAIPFVREEAVTIAHWLNSTQFIDGLALGNVVPTPLVMFATFVGFMADRVPGAVLCTLGMFIPAFAFTMIGHEFFEAVVDTQWLHSSLDGLASTVVGLIAVTAVQLLKNTIVLPLQILLFVLSLYIIFNVSHRFTPIALIGTAIMMGQVLFVSSRFGD